MHPWGRDQTWITRRGSRKRTYVKQFFPSFRKSALFKAIEEASRKKFKLSSRSSRNLHCKRSLSHATIVIDLHPNIKLTRFSLGLFLHCWRSSKRSCGKFCVYHVKHAASSRGCRQTERNAGWLDGAGRRSREREKSLGLLAGPGEEAREPTYCIRCGVGFLVAILLDIDRETHEYSLVRRGCVRRRSPLVSASFYVYIYT